MKIAFLHMTLGLVRRGSEVVTEEIATALAARHDVLVLQSGPVGKTKYHAKRVHPLRSAPPPAPRSVLEKCLFRLGLDARTREVAAFTRAALPAIQAFAPDIIVAINGACLRRGRGHRIPFLSVILLLSACTAVVLSCILLCQVPVLFLHRS